jgi:hypothetical protein
VSLEIPMVYAFKRGMNAPQLVRTDEAWRGEQRFTSFARSRLSLRERAGLDEIQRVQVCIPRRSAAEPFLSVIGHIANQQVLDRTSAIGGVQALVVALAWLWTRR